MEHKITFSVQTPAGTIMAVESPDEHNPGIVLMFLSHEGKELSSCSMQYMEDTERVETRVWGKDDPDGEPVSETGFDAHLMYMDVIKADELDRVSYTIAEFEQMVRNNSIDLDCEVRNVWVDGTEVLASTYRDVAEHLRQNYDFTY